MFNSAQLDKKIISEAAIWISPGKLLELISLELFELWLQPLWIAAQEEKNRGLKI